MENTQTSFDFSTLPLVVSYVGEASRRDGADKTAKPWQCDQWRVVIAGDWSTDYFTGLGLRKASPKAPKCGYPANTLGAENWKRQWVKPVAPDAKAVMHSLLMDGEAVDVSFVDWCDNFGYSDDSLHALSIYRTCCETGTMLRKKFTRAELAAMRDALQDY